MSVQYQNKHDFSFNYRKKIKTPVRDFMWSISPLVFTAYLVVASALLHVSIGQPVVDTEAPITIVIND